MLQEMNYQEREHLKRFSDDEAHQKELIWVIHMISNWHRQDVKVKFHDYASNWAEAQKTLEIPAMRSWWKLTGPRKIADNYSDWLSK